MELIDIIEVDQWTSTGNIQKQNFDEVGLNTIEGGDSESAKVIFGGAFKRLKVKPTDSPWIGRVWFVKGRDGKCEFYKASYDSSD